MKYLDEYRDPRLAGSLIESLRQRDYGGREIRLMEICGTHTVAIFRLGLRELLPPAIRLVSGPGCPVCVTANQDIDRAVWLAEQPGVIVATFGDLLRVPGSHGSLHTARSRGADVRMVYSTLDALQIARENPDKEVVFLGIGFETTAPTVAASVVQASIDRIENFSIYSCHKLLPPAMMALLESDDLRLDGFLCPGHVSTVIGAAAYEDIAGKYHIPCVVTGFEALDLLQGIHLLVGLIGKGTAKVLNQYQRAVSWEGNPAALGLMCKTFEPVDAVWRGLGPIPASGLGLRDEWRRYDAARRFAMPALQVREHPGCRCGEVLRGVLTPPECGLFRSVCSPQNPMGPCMVSSEGTCGAYHRYHRDA